MFNIIIGDETKKFMNVLGIKFFPFTKYELKSKFRELAKVNHPDKINGDDSSMKKINIAYAHIKNLVISDNEIADKGEAILKAENENMDIFELFDTCPDCKGAGEEVQYYQERFMPCDRCTTSIYFFGFWDHVSRGKIKATCRDCQGTGKFKQRKGKKVTCYKCKGRGFLIIRCPKCKGRKVIILEAKTIHNRCGKCGGSGRIKINPFNPAIPKGAVL